MSYWDDPFSEEEEEEFLKDLEDMGDLEEILEEAVKPFLEEQPSSIIVSEEEFMRPVVEFCNTDFKAKGPYIKTEKSPDLILKLECRSGYIPTQVDGKNKFTCRPEK